VGGSANDSIISTASSASASGEKQHNQIKQHRYGDISERKISAKIKMAGKKAKNRKRQINEDNIGRNKNIRRRVKAGEREEMKKNEAKISSVNKEEK